MRFKYYLRGVGVGLILAVIVYSAIIIPHKGNMTDDEIMARARALGMVMQEDTEVDLSALTGTPSPTGEPSIDGEDGDEPDPTQPNESDLTPTPDGLDNGEDVPTPPKKPAAPDALPTMGGQPQPPSDPIRISVTNGMGSETFAIEAEKAGLVEDAADFDRYLMQNGYAENLKVGIFEIPAGSGYEEIARIVTGK